MIEFHSVTLAFGGQTVLDRQSLTAAAGEHLAIMGPSGCGKTSLLRLVAGLEKPSAGSIAIHARRISYVFQSPRLLPWLTAAENVNAVLSGRGATLPLAHAWLEAVALGDAAQKYPRELSGGMQQRVNLARALAYDGEILLLDEPLQGLDEETKASMIALIKTHAAGKTLLLATHDLAEANALAETVYSYRAHQFEKG